MKSIFQASTAIFPYFTLVLCFGSGALTYGLFPNARVPLLFGSFSLLLLFWLSKFGTFNKRKLLHIILGLVYGLMFVFMGYVREQNTVDFINVVFTFIATGFFIVGVLWGASCPSDCKKSNLAVICSLPVLFLLFAKSTSAYTSYLSYNISLMGGGREMSLDTGNPVGVAYANSIAFIAFIFLMISVRNILVKILLICCALLSLYIVVSTASRGATLYLIIALLLFFSAQFFNMQWRVSAEKFFKKAMIFISSFVALVAISFILFQEKLFVLIDRLVVLIQRFSDALGFLQGVSDVDQSTSGRMHVYNYHLKTWTEWIIFGESNYSPYPHNLFLEIVMRIGIIGIPLCLVIIYVLFKNLFCLFNKNIYKSADWYLFYFLFCFSFMQSMTSLSMEINRGIWISLGFLLVYSPRRAYSHNSLRS